MATFSTLDYQYVCTIAQSTVSFNMMCVCMSQMMMTLPPPVITTHKLQNVTQFCFRFSHSKHKLFKAIHVQRLSSFEGSKKRNVNSYASSGEQLKAKGRRRLHL